MKNENNGQDESRTARRPASVESSEAVQEFVGKVATAKASPRPKRASDGYALRPCSKVRGYSLHIPLIQWRLWFPSMHDALDFAKTVWADYQAECRIYGSDGKLETRVGELSRG